MKYTEVDSIGAEWLLEQVNGLADTVDRMSPSEFNERYRYLPESVSPIAGPLSYDVTPYLREIIDCFDMDSPVREIVIMKGAQVGYTTVLESVMFYLCAHVTTVPVMYMTADRDLATARIENNILPMLQHSGFSHIIRSSDEGNSRKTGSTKNHLQWEGGGYLVPFGSNSANKMRQFSILALLKDEIDGWPDTVGRDGDPDALSDSRCAAYWARRKIARGSTPLIEGASKIHKQFLRGDQRKYYVRCLKCGFPQVLVWSGRNKEGSRFGIVWETENSLLLPESVRYLCADCGHEHHEHDKYKLFHWDFGAEWRPTAAPELPEIRSYHLPALYSPAGMQPWSKSVAQYLEAFDHEERKIKDMTKFQVYYNNILGWPFEIRGVKVTLNKVSAHRRSAYSLSMVPNEYASRYSAGPILFLTCQVDVHRDNIAVAVMGWTVGARCYLIDYYRDGDEIDCNSIDSKVWNRLEDLILNRKFKDQSGKEYGIFATFIDARYATSTVTAFCDRFSGWVFPILGRDAPSKTQRIKEFGEWTTPNGTIGYHIVVDIYKDRLSQVLKRDWDENEEQPPYHFNAPIDIDDKSLKELTVETKRENVDKYGVVSYRWHRPSGVRNELWDLLVYGHAGVEIIAWIVCIKHYKLEEVSWDHFWAMFTS